MQDSASKRTPPVGDPSGSGRPSGTASSSESIDPPTIRSSQASGEGSGSGHRAPITAMPLPGERLESFELERSIGVGGMGAVFLATDTRLHREVALKILPPEQSIDSEVVQRFYQEGRAAARLDHENIARVFTIGTDKGYHFIAFEYIEGQTLRQRVQEHGPLPVSEAINFTLQIAGALVHASERGVVHRDIKPSNIIITPQGRAKLVDMGLARRFERGQQDDGLTQSGMTLGTFDYISPEQARDPRDVDVRGDLYSLGCTLFHMLTGRPPFPEGTVLQKLLQHQEEPPPDVRKLNARVSDDLAAILAKLMAKDRDRRYQTPELLARDLLMVAGSLGLRSMSPEGLVWMSPKAPPSWEKHLVWGLPAMALLGIVTFLFWWGQTGPAPLAITDPEPLRPLTSVAANSRETRSQTSSTTAISPASPPPSHSVAAQAKTPQVRPQVPREVVVTTSDDLARALREEASGSTVILGDDGPYLLRPAGEPGVSRRDLTIKAGPQSRPVIRPSRTSVLQPGQTRASLLGFGPGRVTIQDVEFQLDPPESDATWSALRAQGTVLTLKRCVLRAAAGSRSQGRLCAIEIEPPSPSTSPAQEWVDPSSLWADASQFEGGQMAIRVQGAANLRIRDSTFAVSSSVLWMDNASAPEMVPVDVGLSYVSIRMGRDPMLRISQTNATVAVDHSVIAASKDRDGMLASVDQADRLDWRGLGNLYSGIGTYLVETQAAPGRDPIRRFTAWSDDPRAFRETESVASETPVWVAPESSTEMTQSKGLWEFAIVPRTRSRSGDVGARRTPQGPVAPLSGLGASVAEASPRSSNEEPASTEPFAKSSSTSSNPLALGPTLLDPGLLSKPPASSPVTTEATLPGPSTVSENAGKDVVKPMPMAPMGFDPTETATLPRVAEPPNDVVAREKPVEKEGVNPAEPIAIKTPEALQAEILRLGDRGGSIRLAGDADLILPSLVIRGPGRIVIEPPPGEERPRLRFRPSSSLAKDSQERAAMVAILGGSLELRRVDVVLSRDDAPENGLWSAFALRTGTDLTLNRCTVTVEGPSTRSAIVSLARPDEPIGGGLLDFEAAAQVRATDCLLRGGGDLIDVEPGRKLDLELNNCMVATSGSLVHGHGGLRGSRPEVLKIGLRQVSARVSGGLVYLESLSGSPELPLADVTARDSIFTTGDRSAPLVRLDGQDELDLLQDRFQWNGSGVVYHGIDVYRRHQTSQTGTVPQNFDRNSWEVAVGSREKMPVHGDANFLNVWPRSRSAWSLEPEDLRLQPNSPSSAGADWQRIPPGPSLPIR